MKKYCAVCAVERSLPTAPVTVMEFVNCDGCKEPRTCAEYDHDKATWAESAKIAAVRGDRITTIMLDNVEVLFVRKDGRPCVRHGDEAVVINGEYTVVCGTKEA